MKKYLMFLAANDGGEGGTATLEQHAEPPMTSVGDVYTKALAEATKGGEPVTKAEPEKPATKEEPSKEAAKPASALEAALAEKPAATEKVEDTDPLKDLPETLPNENRKDHWAKARAAIKTFAEKYGLSQKEITDLKTKLDQAKANPESKAELENYKAKVAELTDAITAANVELLPEFRAKYIDGRTALIAKAAEKAKAYGGNPEALKEALTMPEGLRRDAAIEEALGDDVKDMARTKVNAIISQLDDLNEQAQNERANSQQAYERLTARQKEQQTALAQENEGRKQATFEAVTKRLQSEVPLLRLVDPSVAGAEDWNAKVKAAFEGAKELFGPNATPEQTVEAAVKYKDYDRVANLLSESWKENGQLRKQLAELDGAQPDIKGGRATMKKGKEAALEKDPGQIYNETMAALSASED